MVRLTAVVTTTDFSFFEMQFVRTLVISFDIGWIPLVVFSATYDDLSLQKKAYCFEQLCASMP